MQQFFIYSNFKTKMADLLFVYLSMRMRGIKRSRGEEFTRSRMRVSQERTRDLFFNER